MPLSVLSLKTEAEVPRWATTALLLDVCSYCDSQGASVIVARKGLLVDCRSLSIFFFFFFFFGSLIFWSLASVALFF